MIVTEYAENNEYDACAVKPKTQLMHCGKCFPELGIIYAKVISDGNGCSKG